MTMIFVSGTMKAFFQKGVKYAKQVCDHTKTAYSIMLYGSAAGELLPPYILYKGINVWEKWCKGGPENAKYNSTPSGWF
jgi:hypothetical protein